MIVSIGIETIMGVINGMGVRAQIVLLALKITISMGTGKAISQVLNL